MLGDLDLLHPRPPQAAQPVHYSPESPQPLVLHYGNIGSSATTMPFVPQPLHVQPQHTQVQYVYRAPQ